MLGIPQEAEAQEHPLCILLLPGNFFLSWAILEPSLAWQHVRSWIFEGSWVMALSSDDSVWMDLSKLPTFGLIAVQPEGTSTSYAESSRNECLAQATWP